MTRSGEILTKLDQNFAELGHQGQHVGLRMVMNYKISLSVGKNPLILMEKMEKVP